MGSAQSINKVERDYAFVDTRPKEKRVTFMETNSDYVNPPNLVGIVTSESNMAVDVIQCEKIFSCRMPAGIVGRLKGWEYVFPFTAMMCDETHRLWPYEGTFNRVLSEFTQTYVNELVPDRAYVTRCFDIWRDVGTKHPCPDQSALAMQLDKRLLRLIETAASNIGKHQLLPLARELRLDLVTWGPHIDTLSPPVAATAVMYAWVMNAQNRPFLYDVLCSHLSKIGLRELQISHQCVKTESTHKASLAAAARTTDELITYAVAINQNQEGSDPQSNLRNAGIQTSFDDETPPQSPSSSMRELSEQPTYEEQSTSTPFYSSGVYAKDPVYTGYTMRPQVQMGYNLYVPSINDYVRVHPMEQRVTFGKSVKRAAPAFARKVPSARSNEFLQTK